MPASAPAHEIAGSGSLLEVWFPSGSVPRHSTMPGLGNPAVFILKQDLTIAKVTDQIPLICLRQRGLVDEALG